MDEYSRALFLRPQCPEVWFNHMFWVTFLNLEFGASEVLCVRVEAGVFLQGPGDKDNGLGAVMWGLRVQPTMRLNLKFSSACYTNHQDSHPRRVIGVSRSPVSGFTERPHFMMLWRLKAEALMSCCYIMLQLEQRSPFRKSFDPLCHLPRFQ